MKPQAENNPEGDQLPETDYYHGQGSSGTTVPRAIDPGSQSSVIDWEPVVETVTSRVRTYDEMKVEAVPVRVVDSAYKTKTTRHQITSQPCAPGVVTRVVGKDPTRTKVRIVVIADSGTDMFVVPDISSQSALYGFPLIRNTYLETESEDEICVFNAHASATYTVYVFAEYVRPDTTRIEQYQDREHQ